MKNKINEILKELYAIDSSLQKDEKLIVRVIEKLLKSKPDVEIDENFIKILRNQLLSKIEKPGLSFNPFKIWQPYAVSVIAIVILVVAGLVVFKGDKAILNLGINKVGDKAFGELVIDASRQQAGGGTELGIGGGGGGGMPGISMPGSMIEFKYVYVGDDFSLNEGTAPVYKKVSNDSASRVFAKSISKINFDSINISKLRDMKVDNIFLSEDRDYGYTMSLDFRSSSFSISKNWEKWPMQENLTLPEFPEDQKILSVANSFIDSYSIDMSNYAQGKANKQWRESAIATSERMYGLDANITYQLLIDGKGVYDEWGNQVGINASVDIVNMKVSNVGNIIAQSYDKSEYELETDKNKIFDFIDKNNGMPVYYGSETSIKTVEYKLGTPIETLVQVYMFNEGKQAEILYVPALAFPIIDSSDSDYYQREALVVPITKEILKQKIESLEN